MKSRKDKKIFELEILDLFRERFDDFPKGVLRNSESPDFILSLSARNKIGIELVRLHQQIKGRDLYSYENLSACLYKKEEKLRIYRKKRLQEYWLIMFDQDPANKPVYNLNNKLIVWKFKTEYNKVFLFRIEKGEIFLLSKGN